MYEVKNQSDFTSLTGYIGHKLKLKRLAMKTSQTELGKMIGVTCQQVQKYENGKNKINIEALYKIANFWHIDIKYFFEGFNSSASYSVSDQDNLQFGMISEDMEKDLATLGKYFRKLKDNNIRKKILDLVKALSSSVTE